MISESSEKRELPEVSYTIKSTKLDLFLSGIRFPRDSIVQLYQRTAFTRENWIMFGSTEIISGTKNPVFKHPIHLHFFFSVLQQIRLEVIEANTSIVVGRAELVFANLINAPEQRLCLPLIKPYASNQEESMIIVKTALFTDCQDEIRFQLAATFFKSYVFTPKTFFSLWRMDPNQSKHIPLLKGETIVGNVPNWPAVKMKVMDLCEKDYSRILRIVVHKIPKVHQEKVMGHADFILDDILRGSVKSGELIKCSEKGGDEQKKQVGKIFIQQKDFIRVPQFVDYLFGGLDIASVLAVDFSNKGDSYMNPSSLHYHSEESLSQYERLIRAVAEVLMPFSLSKSIGFFGFGADNVLETNGFLGKDSQECFSMPKNQKGDAFTDISTMLDSYRSMLTQLETSTIRFVTPALKSIVNRITQDIFFTAHKKHYIIVFLVEDDVEDLQEMIDYIATVSDIVPLSLFLIGMDVGLYSSLGGFSVYNQNRPSYYDSRGEEFDPYIINFISIQEISDGPNGLVKELFKMVPDRIYLQMMAKNIEADNFQEKFIFTSVQSAATTNNTSSPVEVGTDDDVIKVSGLIRTSDAGGNKGSPTGSKSGSATTKGSSIKQKAKGFFSRKQ